MELPVDFPLPQHALFTAKAGSRLIGIHNDDSDYDVVTVFMPPKDSVLGFTMSPLPQLKPYVEGKWQKYDYKQVTFPEFMKRSFQNHRPCLEAVCVKPTDVVFHSPFGSAIWDTINHNRYAILGREVAMMYWHTGLEFLKTGTHSYDRRGLYLIPPHEFNEGESVAFSKKLVVMAIHCFEKVLQLSNNLYSPYHDFEKTQMLHRFRHDESIDFAVVQSEANRLREYIEPFSKQNFDQIRSTKNVTVWNDLTMRFMMDYLYMLEKQGA